MTLAASLGADSSATRQDSVLGLSSGVEAQPPIIHHPRIFPELWKAFWLAGNVVQGLGVIITKRPLTLEKKEEKKGVWTK